MKKALLFFLLLGLFPAYTSARPAGNFPVQASRVQGQAIAQQVKAQLKKQPSQPDTSFLVPEEALQDVIEKNPPQVISWQQFLQLNKRAKERDVVSRRMDLKTLQQRTQKQNMIFHNSWPDYATLLKGFTYIYVGEMHGTQSTPAEMIRLLQAVRQLNPDKRILLASEFSIAGQLDDFPLEQANTSSSLFQMYPEVKNAADALDIDQLSLDSRLGTEELELYQDEKGIYMLIQAGRYLVKHYLKNLEEDKIIEEFFNMDVIIGASPFGILERNRQWTRYLQAVQPFYDIIVVYAGQSHVVNTLSNDLPYMLKTPHFISLFLFPMEKTPTEIAQDYTTMEKRIKQQNLGLLDESFQINQEIQRLSSELQQTDGDCSDSSKPCWGVQDLPSNQDSAQRGSKEGVVFLPITGVKMPDINRPAPTIHEAQPKKQPQKKQDSLRYGNSYI